MAKLSESSGGVAPQPGNGDSPAFEGGRMRVEIEVDTDQAERDIREAFARAIRSSFEYSSEELQSIVSASAGGEGGSGSPDSAPPQGPTSTSDLIFELLLDEIRDLREIVERLSDTVTAIGEQGAL